MGARMNQPEDLSGAEVGVEIRGSDGSIFLQLALRGTSAGQLADLESLIADIQFARDCAATYLQRNSDTDLVRRALWTSACVAYRRVFTKGKGHLSPQTPRPRPNENFTKALTADQLAAHNEVLEIANRHVAHRVGELEKANVLALLNPPPKPRSVVGVAPYLVHQAAPLNPVIESFIAVCDILLAGTVQERERACTQALMFLQQQDINHMYEQVAERARREQGSF
jgi:hypothetical protein